MILEGGVESQHIAQRANALGADAAVGEAVE